MSGRDRRRLQLCLFLWGAAEGLFLYLVPLYVRALGGDAVAVGLNFAAQAAAAGLCTVLAGPIVDRVGHRPLIRFSSLVVLPAIGLMAVAPRWEWIIPGTVLYGVSFAVIPALNAYVSAGHDDAVGAFGSIFSFFSLGMIVTPGIGGLVAAQFHSIRPVFVLTLSLYALTLALIWNVPPRAIEPHEALGVALRAVVTNRRLLALCAYLVALLFAASMTNSFLAPYLQDVDHQGDASVGLLGACVSAGEFLMGLALGRLTRRLGRVLTLIALQAALGLSLLMILGVHWTPALALAFLLRGAIVTMGTMVLAFVGDVLPPRQQGAGFGLMELGYQVGMVLAAATGGFLYAGAPARPYLASLALLVLTAAATGLAAPLFAATRRPEPLPDVHVAR